MTRADDPHQLVTVATFGAGPHTPAPHADAPLYIHDWHLLLRQCRSSLQRRREAYPRLIEARGIAPDVAAADIAAWEALVAEWTWVETGAGAPPPLHTFRARLAAVELGLVRVKQEMDRGNRGHDVLAQSHLLQALEWHLLTADASGEPAIHRLSRINHAARADRGQRYCGTCERWSGDAAIRACTSTECGLSAADRLPALDGKAA